MTETKDSSILALVVLVGICPGKQHVGTVGVNMWLKLIQVRYFHTVGLLITSVIASVSHIPHDY